MRRREINRADKEGIMDCFFLSCELCIDDGFVSLMCERRMRRSRAGDSGKGKTENGVDPFRELRI